MSPVFRPSRWPPKLDEYYGLSIEAQKTLVALKKKYARLSDQYYKAVGMKKDPSEYYRSIYNATFKKEVTSPIDDTSEKLIQSHPPSIPQISLSSAVSSVQAHNNQIHKAFQSFNSVSYSPSNAGKGWPQNRSSGEGCKRNRFVSEIIMEHGPTDKDISESVLSLTQKTSAEDSPSMDFDTDMETESLDQQNNSAHERKNESALWEKNEFKNSQQFSADNWETVFKNATYQRETLAKCKASETVSAKERRNECLKKTPTQIFIKSPICQISCMTDNRTEECVIPCIAGQSNKDVLIKVEKLQCEKAPACKESSPFLQNCNDSEEPHFTLSFSDFESSQNSLTQPTTPKNNIEVSVESPIAFSNDHCDSICMPNWYTESPNMKNIYKASTLLFDEENDLPSKTESKEHTKNVESYNRKPVTGKCSFKKQSKAVSKDVGLLRLGSKKYGCKVESTDKEQPFSDLEKSTSPISRKESYESLSNGKKVRKDNSISLVTKKLERSSKKRLKNIDSSEVALKRSSKEKSVPTSKKMKSGFRPPGTVKPNTSQTTDSTSEDAKETVPVTDFSSLSAEKQKEAIRLMEDSKCLTLLLLYNNDETTANTFYTASNYCRKRHLTTQIQIKKLMILSDNPHMDCLMIPADCSNRESVKVFLLETLHSKHIKKIIPNSKDFLIGMHHFLLVDNIHGMKCENVEDPVIATWLVDPENQPSSFTQMCHTAGVSFKDDEQDWLVCLQFTYKLMEALRAKLKSSKLWMLFTQIEMRLVPLLACMESSAISIDMTTLVKFSDILKSKLANLEEEIYKRAGHEFLLSSHVQLRQPQLSGSPLHFSKAMLQRFSYPGTFYKVLYEELQLEKKLPAQAKIGKTSITQRKSTCESSLILLSSVHNLPSLVLEYRQLQKLKSTYVDGIMSCVSNGALMTHWDQTAAATGRLTSSQPNIQTIPKTFITVKDYKPNYIIGSESSEVNIFAREPFVSNPGHVFLAADFQQIELRILAHLSEDNALLSMFWKPQAKDIFISLASQWKNKPTESVTFSEREQTKRIVYSVMYGVGKEKLSEYLKVKPQDAKDYMKSFLLQFPAIETFTKKCVAYAKEFGYTETVCGRRRYFPHINSQSPALRAQAQRQAVNFCVQGTAADICKLAMLAVEKKLQEQNHLTCRLLIQIHDELVWDVPEDQIIETKELIQQVMEDTKSLCQQFCSLQVPLTVALSSGKSWAHLLPFPLPEEECEIDDNSEYALGHRYILIRDL